MKTAPALSKNWKGTGSIHIGKTTEPESQNNNGSYDAAHENPFMSLSWCNDEEVADLLRSVLAESVFYTVMLTIHMTKPFVKIRMLENFLWFCSMASSGYYLIPLA